MRTRLAKPSPEETAGPPADVGRNPLQARTVGECYTKTAWAEDRAPSGTSTPGWMPCLAQRMRDVSTFAMRPCFVSVGLQSRELK